MWLSPSDRVTSIQLILRSIFIDLRDDEDGGGVCIKGDGSAVLNITSSKFLLCVAGQNGGGVYFSGKNSILTKTCFEFCEALNDSIYHYGNAFSVKSEDTLTTQETANIKYVSCYACGINPYGLADSTGLVSSMDAFVENVNFSKNSNYYGNVFIYSVEKLTANCVNIVDGASSYVVYTRAKPNIFSHSNIINSNSTLKTFGSWEAVYTFRECCLFPLGSITSNFDLIFENCIGNTNLIGIKIGSTTAIPLSLSNAYACFVDKITVRGNSKLNFLNSLFLFSHLLHGIR